MLKLLGCALLAGGGLTLGLAAAGELDRRIGALEAFAAALRLLEDELSLRCASTPELLELLSRRARAPARDFFAACAGDLERLGQATFEDIWTQALSRLPGGGEDLRPFAALGSILGRYDVNSQRAAACAARERLEETARALRDRRAREGRTCPVLGLCLGLFAAIALL